MRGLILGALLLASGPAAAQTFPSPTFNALTVNGKLFLNTAGSKFQQYYNNTVPMVANPSCALAQQWFCSHAWYSGTITGGTTFAQFTFSDVVSSTQNTSGLLILHNVAGSGNSASGPRVALDVLLSQVGSLQGGSITNAGISSAGRVTTFMQSNLGGTSSAYAGDGNGLNASCQVYASATFVNGCSGFEVNFGAYASTSFNRLRGFLLVQTGNAQSLGRLGGDIGMQVVNQVGFTTGLSTAFLIGGQTAAWPLDLNGYGKIFYTQRSHNTGAYPAKAATVLDAAAVIVKGPTIKGPYWSEVPLQATGITGSTRLTTDGTSATGYIHDAIVTNEGTGYTSYPTVTVTGCSGAVVNAAIGSGNVIGELGVKTPGLGCAAEATIAISGGGGSSATGSLVIAGNTLNFPIKSSVYVECRVVADTFATGGTDSVTWSINFSATMGATASTTVIVGSPTWSVVSQTTGAAAKFSGSAPSAPAADTTLGAINLTIVPTTGTWNVGGICRMVRSAQV